MCGRYTLSDPDADAESLLDLLAPVAAARIEFHPVSRIVNSPKNDVPACLEPVA